QQMAEAGRFDCVIDMVGYLPADGESVVRAFRGRVGHFLFCSTVDVYRKPATRYPYTEAEAYGGLNAYSRRKVQIERTLLAAHHPSDFPVTIIRPAYTYGEGRGPLHSLGGRTTYIDRIRKGLPIVVHGDGSSLWVCCHRHDVAQSFANAAGQSHTFGQCYHTTGEDWMTWNQYHERVAAAIGAPSPTVVHIPTDLLGKVAPKRAAIDVENFQFNNIFDNSAARNDLGFTYTISWEEGVRRMVDWLDAHNRVETSADDPFDDRLIAAWERLGTEMGREFHEELVAG
ncbi:MAG TPA: NAD-dependent epimerase/dehydratase family protein, partial [Caldilineaceae bacterium]|nr:NAD-dependent epimerase/dehydratase family protein [Caldilineaceae bacterium]